jgi:DNA-binding beta-propeller fold protein YncE
MMAALAISGCAQEAGTLFGGGAGRTWPAPPEQARICSVGALTSSADLKAAVSGREAFASVIRGKRSPISFSSPHGVAKDAGSKLAVADTGLAAVHIVDLETRSHTLVNGCNDNRFDAPLSVTWMGERLFVTDAGRHEVVELDSAGACRGAFGTGELKRPVGIVAIPSRNELAVVDGDADAVVFFDLQGRSVRRFGTRGSGAGELNHPTHIAFDGSAHLAVADTANFRVQIFDLEGTSTRVIGQKGDAAGDFSLPKGLAYDSDGHLYVVDTHFENVQIFDGEGRLLLAFGEEGSKLGQFALPAGIAIDRANRLWIADSANHRVQVFDYLGGPPSEAVERQKGGAS